MVYAVRHRQVDGVGHALAERSTELAGKCRMRTLKETLSPIDIEPREGDANIEHQGGALLDLWPRRWSPRPRAPQARPWRRAVAVAGPFWRDFGGQICSQKVE